MTYILMDSAHEKILGRDGIPITRNAAISRRNRAKFFTDATIARIEILNRGLDVYGWKVYPAHTLERLWKCKIERSTGRIQNARFTSTGAPPGVRGCNVALLAMNGQLDDVVTYGDCTNFEEQQKTFCEKYGGRIHDSSGMCAV